jgi:hypothetical protein
MIVDTNPEGGYAVPYGPQDKIAIQQSIGVRVDVRILIQRSQLWKHR